MIKNNINAYYYIYILILYYYNIRCTGTHDAMCPGDRALSPAPSVSPAAPPVHEHNNERAETISIISLYKTRSNNNKSVIPTSFYMHKPHIIMYIVKEKSYNPNAVHNIYIYIIYEINNNNNNILNFRRVAGADAIIILL